MTQNTHQNGSNNILPSFSKKRMVFIILIALGLYLLIPRLVGVEEALRHLYKANPFFIVLAFLSEIISYIGIALLIKAILARLGYRIAFLDCFRIGTITAFAIHFLPVGNLGGGVAEYYFLKKRGVRGGSVLLGLIIRMMFSYTALLLIFLIGLLTVPNVPEISFSPRLIALLLFSIIIAGIIYMVFLYRKKNHFWALWQRIYSVVDRVFANVGVDEFKKEGPEKMFEDLHHGIGLFTRNKRRLVIPLSAAVLYWLGDIACLYFVLRAFNFSLYPGIVMFAYGVGTLAGIISFIPGGLGVTEGSLSLILGSMGVSLKLVVIPVLVFRLLSFWMWIPLGLLSFLSLKGDNPKIRPPRC